MDASALVRTNAALPETVTSAGTTATRKEVVAWANTKFGLDGEYSALIFLKPALLTKTVPTVDWVDEYGIRHVRLRQYFIYDDYLFV